MPLYMRLPKRGFKNAPFKKVYAIVSLDQIEQKVESDVISREILIESGLLKGINKRLPIKILNGETFSKKLTFVGIDKYSASASKKITEVGSTIKE